MNNDWYDIYMGNIPDIPLDIGRLVEEHQSRYDLLYSEYDTLNTGCIQSDNMQHHSSPKNSES